jgi:tetratricopeptide (TPR) repeat protein
LQEAVHRALMRLYVRQGRRAAALAQYRMCREVLRRDLGVEPEAETEALYRELVHQPPAGEARTNGVTVAPPASPRPAAPRRRRRPRWDPTAIPLIGRSLELERLREALDEAWSGRGQLVAVLGPAGIGKTRLVEDVGEAAARRDGSLMIGRCYETEQIFPFGPWIDAVRGMLRTHDIEGLDPVWRAELGRLLPEFGEAPAPREPAAEYRRLFEAVVQLAVFFAIRRPLVVVLEDLHWADEMTQRLLSFFGRRTREHAVLTLATARDDELDGVPVFRRMLEEFDREDQLLRLVLPPLTYDHTAELVRRLATVSRRGASLTDLSSQIWTTSEGNPFVIVETVRALEDGDETPGGAAVPLPHRVQQLVTRRLDRLSENAQRLAGIAAVIGRDFEFQLLRAVAGLQDHEVAEGLEELARRHVLHAADERFRFTHDRIRETVYTGLLAPTRRVLHGRVARTIEHLYVEKLAPHYLTLAMHLRAAEAWERAATYFRRAGAEAYVRWGHREALACFEQALAALGHLPDDHPTLESRADLYVDIRRVHHFLAEPGLALEQLGAAEGIVRSLDDRGRLGYVLNYRCIELQALGSWTEAVTAGEEALTIAEAVGDFTLEIEARSHLGQACHGRGDYARAHELLARAVAELEQDQARERSGLASRFAAARGSLFGGFPRSAHLSGARFSLITCLAELGEFAEASALGDRALREAEEGEEPNSLARALARLGRGILGLFLGEIDHAVAELERALEICRRGDITLHLTSAMAALGSAYGLAGRVDEGRALLEKATELACRRRENATTLRLLGEIHLRAGALERATALVQRALEAARRYGERGPEARALCALGDLARRQAPDRADLSEGHYAAALALAEAGGMRSLAARCELSLGETYVAAGRLEEGRARLTRATDRYRSMGVRVFTERAMAALANLPSNSPAAQHKIAP